MSGDRYWDTGMGVPSPECRHHYRHVPGRGWVDAEEAREYDAATREPVERREPSGSDGRKDAADEGEA
jgi:hypothetical protein